MGKIAKDPSEKIEESRKFLESVFDRIPGMIYIHDLVNDVNLYRSWSLRRILGYEESSVLRSGKGIRGLLHEADLPEFKRATKEIQCVKDNECVRFTYRMRHNDGSWLWFQSEEYVYERDKLGKPTKVLGYAVDLTSTIEQQEQLDEVNRVNQLLLNAAQILSKPDNTYKQALQQLAKEVAQYLNVVCDISILDPETDVIRPEALYYGNKEIREIIQGLFASISVKKGQGMVGSVIASGKEFFMNEVPEQIKVGPRSVDPRITPRSLMYVPLKGSQSVLGSMNLTRLEGQDPFSDVHVDQIRRLGEYLSLFVENSLLKERKLVETELRIQAERQLANDKNWADFKIEISSLLADVDIDLTSLLQLFTKKVAIRFNVVCDVQMVDRDRNSILMVAFYHREKKVRLALEKHIKKATLKLGEGLVGNVVETGKEYVKFELPEELQKRAAKGKVVQTIMPSSLAYLPLRGHHEIIGTLDVTRLHSQDPLTQQEVQQLRDLADHAGRFIENRVLQIRQKQEIQLRRKAEQKLERASRILEKMEAETRAILNTIPIYIARISKDFRYFFLNETYTSMGLDPRKMEGRYIKDVIGEKGFIALLPQFNKALSGQTVTYDYDGIMADGEHRYFNVALAPDYSENGEVTGFFSCASDITSKIEAETETQLTQDRLETLSLNSGDAFFFHDSNQQILDVNQVSVDMLGYDREELLTMKAYQIDPRWKGKVYQDFLDNLEVNTPQTFDTSVFHKNGREIPVEVRFVKRLEGENLYIQSLIRDRTEKREQELKLQRSEERLRLIFDNVEDYIATINKDGIFESINKTSHGLEPEEVIGTSIYDIYKSKEKIQKLKDNFKNLIAKGENFETEDAFTDPQGSNLVYNRKFIGIFDGQKISKVILIVRDVTAERDREYSVMNAVLKGQEQERKRLGAELHDGIGQVMSAIALQVSQIKEEVNEKKYDRVSSDLHELTGKLQAAIREVRNISHDLMPEVLESFGLKEAIKQTCNNLKDRSGINVTFDHTDLNDRYDQLVEVNLYRVAQELMTNIQRHADCKNVFVSLIDHGDSLNLTVEDDGKGFEWVSEKEFKGIGLSNVYSRVNLLGGEIDVESDENSGTLVNIEVPKKIV